MTIFYDGQLRRYLTQVGAVFHGFQWKNSAGEARVVPVKMASSDRQVNHILMNNSENTILSCPSISFHLTDLEMDDARRVDPSLVSQVNLVEREIVNGKYTGNRGITSSIERLAPVPYKMTVEVNIWSSNTDQKHQLLEQILLIFNPELTIQTSTNAIDWTALTYMKLTSVSYSSRSIPTGTDQDIDVSTLTFEIPIFLNPPAKVKRSNLIEQIIVNIGTAISEPCCGEGQYIDDLLSRAIFTPRDHRVSLSGGVVTLLSHSGLEVDDTGKMLEWKWLFERMGEIRPGVSQLRIKTTDNMDDHASDIVGFISHHPDANKLFWTPDLDSLPANTLAPISAIIDPSKTGPGAGLVIGNGVRYLLAGDVGRASRWGIDAHEGNILQYNGTGWDVVFANPTDQHYVLNTHSGKQLKWTGREWILAIDGVYNPGYWRLFL